MPRWAFDQYKHPMPLANPLSEITPQEDWLANYLRGKVAHPANSRQESKNTQISENGSPRKLYEPGDLKYEFKTRDLGGNWKTISVNLHRNGDSGNRGVINDDQRTDAVTHSVGHDCDLSKRHGCDFTNRHMWNILPSKIKNSQCYVNYRFCTHDLNGAVDGKPKCCATAPDVVIQSGLPEDGRSSCREEETNFSSDYMKRKYREARLRDATQHTPDARSRRKSFEVSLDREKVGTKYDKPEYQTPSKCSVSPAQENSASDDRSGLRSTRTFDADDDTQLHLSQQCYFDHRSEADTDGEISSTKSQQGSSPRQSDLDDWSEYVREDVQLRQETDSGARPYRGSDLKYLPGMSEREDHHERIAALDAPKKFPDSKFCQLRQEAAEDRKITTDRSSSPLHVLKPHDSPSCDEKAYSDFTNEKSRFNSASVLASKGNDDWAKPFTDYRGETDGGNYLVSSEECSPSSVEEVSVEDLPQYLINSQCDETNSASKETYSAELPTSSDKHAVPDTESKIPETVNPQDECIFERTSVTVLHDSWDPVEQYQSRQVKVRNVPFSFSDMATKKTKCDSPSKEDKATMVHTHHRKPVAPQPEVPDVKTGVCAGCKLNVRHMSNYIIIGDYLRKLYTHDQLCDVIVHVGSYTFSAHRIVLAAHSAFFARLFLEDSKKPPTEISLDGHGISSAGFQTVLSHIYFGEVELSLENVGEVYTAAKFLQIRSLQSMCEDLQDHFTPDSALIVIDLTGSGRIGNDTRQRALSVVTSSFHDICQSGTFMSLEVKRLCEILGSDDLAVTSELEVFQAALRWLNMDLAGRAIHMQPVMNCVRFVHMEPDEIIRCTEELPGLLEDLPCRQQVLAAHWFSNHRSLGNSFQVPNDIPPMRKCLLTVAKPPTLPEKAPLPDESECASGEYLTSSSGTSPKECSSSDRDLDEPCMCQDKDNDVSENPPKDPRTLVEELVDISSGTTWHIKLPSAEDGANGDSTIIALIGGMANRPACMYPCMAAVGAAMKLYDESAGSWSQHSQMLEPRYLHAIAVVSGMLYVAGGADPLLEKDGILQPTNTLFKLDIAKGVWSQVASMQHKRVYHKLCQIDRLLYVVGGQDENQRVLSSVEAYNAITDSWVPVAPLSKGRLGMGMAAHRGLIYVVGGYSETYDNISGQHIMSNVECFNPSTNRWFQKSQLRVPRCHAELVEVNGNLYLCGGATQSFTCNKSVLTSVPTLDSYDEDHDSWFVVNRLTLPRHSAAVAATGNNIYIFGGLNSSEDSALKSYERFNISTNTVEKMADDMPWACVGMTAVAIPDCMES